VAFVDSFQVGLQQDFFLGEVTLGSGIFFGPGIGIPKTAFPPATTSGNEVATELDVPAGAVVNEAVLRVSAAAPNRTPISGVATVRASAGNPDGPSESMIIDFGVMRNVSAVEGPASITRVTPWIGTTFDDGGFREGGSVVEMQELQTERLLVEFTESVSTSEVAAEHVTTTTPPADLELLVAGTRAWFRQGPVPEGFSQDVDVTAAVQTAVTAGTSPVPVVLKARVAGHLELAPVGEVQFLRTHVVTFPQGPTTVADALSEGVVDVALPRPDGGENWVIHRVISTVSAEDRGPARVLPPTGPALLGDVELTLNADRRLVARLAPAALTPFATLIGVRLLLLPGSSGIGVVGGLLGGTLVEPGEPLPGGEVNEVAVDASTAAAWVTLPFVKPLTLPAKETLWFSIAATRGTAVLGLREVGSTEPEDGVTVLRHIAPNGVARALSAPVGLRTDALAVRLVGTAPQGQPLDLFTVGLGKRPVPAGSVVEQPSVTEPSDGPDRYVRALATPGPVPELGLRIITLGPTRLTVGPVVIAYEETT
jgi:hypothetical protein